MQKFYMKEVASVTALNSPEKVYEEFKDLGDADQESFWIVGTNIVNKIILKDCIFLGGFNSVNVDIKLIFRRLLQAGCSSFFCIHNHPGGTAYPSEDDKKVTNKLEKVACFIELKLLDHIIISDGYYSFKESGLL